MCPAIIVEKNAKTWLFRLFKLIYDPIIVVHVPTDILAFHYIYQFLCGSHLTRSLMHNTLFGSWSTAICFLRRLRVSLRVLCLRNCNEMRKALVHLVNWDWKLSEVRCIFIARSYIDHTSSFHIHIAIYLERLLSNAAKVERRWTWPVGFVFLEEHKSWSRTVSL